MQRFLLVFLICVLCSPAFACSCAGSGPPCSEAVRPYNSTIFLGTVISISAPIQNEAHPLYATVRVTFSVEEAYKGPASKTITIETPSQNSACGFHFQKGMQYLVYAGEYQGKLGTSLCTRTRPASAAAADLEYLRKMSRLPEMAEVFGTYERYTYDSKFVPSFTPSIMDHYRPEEAAYRAMAPMTGETVTLTSSSGETRATKVRADGRFSFSGLLPGKYSIRTTAPARLAPPRGYVSGMENALDAMDLLPRGCVEVTFRTEPDGRIQGIIVDQHGQPVPMAELRIWNAGLKDFNLHTGYRARLNAQDDGTFELGPMPPGKYVLGAFVWKLPQGWPANGEDSNRLASATLRFFPDAPKYALARPITLEFGQHVTNIRLQVPFNPEEWKDVKVNH